MMDRYTARALVEAGQMSSEEYLRLFGEELRAARDNQRAERDAQRREYAAQARRDAPGEPGGAPEAERGTFDAVLTQRVTRVGERPHVARAKGGGPLGPRAAALFVVHGAEEREVVQPPRLLGNVGAQGVRAFGVTLPFHVKETSERRSRRLLLQSSDGGVFNPCG